MINLDNIVKSTIPFDHYVIDNFFDLNFARDLEKEFIDFNSEMWYCYNNQIENKKALANWGSFPEKTYSVFSYLCSNQFTDSLKKITGINSLYPDYGLHGGGWHMHSSGGKLNIHKDYSIHPKVNLQRKLNLIIYLTEKWDPNWGGSLEFWSHDPDENKPRKKIKDIKCIFNRAVLFDTTQNSWHGLPVEINCPKNFYRKSIAIYYLTDITNTIENRKRALYAPYEEQKNNPEIIKLIKERSSYS
jgi:Rps23 Pro-64 3,4-dihydroxylase Tpa1-like proline 4-hydroxylase